MKKTGKELIEAERQRQIDKEGYTADHDDIHADGSLAAAARCYYIHDLKAWKKAMGKKVPLGFPWDKKYWKPSDNPVKNLVRAGALYLAERDKMQRMADRVANKIDKLNHVTEGSESILRVLADAVGMSKKETDQWIKEVFEVKKQREKCQKGKVCPKRQVVYGM